MTGSCDGLLRAVRRALSGCGRVAVTLTAPTVVSQEAANSQHTILRVPKGLRWSHSYPQQWKLRSFSRASGLAATPFAPGFRGFSTSASRKKDPYDCLGVSRNASASDIKLRYRELAKRYHPDLNPDPSAAAKMAEITTAYQLLSDPEKRSFYDQTGVSPDEPHVAADAGGAGFNVRTNMGEAFTFSDFADIFQTAFAGTQGGRGARSRTGEDVMTDVTLELLEAARGVRKRVQVNVKTLCGDCGGDGCAAGTHTVTCKTCGGTGTQRFERGPIIFGTVCSRCSGSGKIVAHPCRSCKGSGVRVQPRSVDLDIPAGVREGMQLRVKDQGHSGLSGGRPGDLYVTVRVLQHPQFRIIDDDVHVEVALTFKQCLLGGHVEIPTLDGPIKMLVLPKTRPGDVKVLRAKGLRRMDALSFGDLVVHWTLKPPEQLTPRMCELIEEFDALQFNIPYEPKSDLIKRNDPSKKSQAHNGRTGKVDVVPDQNESEVKAFNSRTGVGDDERHAKGGEEEDARGATAREPKSKLDKVSRINGATVESGARSETKRKKIDLSWLKRKLKQRATASADG